ncbi:MAG: UDP-N-acetylglucosamine 4,6-dehydratase (inverting) [Actinomycetota bacterium]
MIDLNGKTILLTGGTGSFGNAFLQRITSTWPNAVVRVYSRDELKQSELRAKYGDEQVRYLIGDVRDRARMSRAAEGADIVVHAAAMKQVEACEYNPFEAVRTNVLGAQHVVDSAIDARVPQVVALSTDKAVNPVNLYGATKLCQEKIFVQGNAYASQRDTRLACVRYGNVVGSRGSVVPVFRQQMKREGRLTITDERMTRFWIMLPQAVDLVLHALEKMEGGEVFIPKIPSMRVTDLAEAIAPGVPREIIGIRPGEKLHELMITADESRHCVDTGDVFVVLPEHPWWNEKGPATLGRPLPDGFVYASDTNDVWLTVPQLRAMLGDATFAAESGERGELAQAQTGGPVAAGASHGDRGPQVGAASA